MPDTQSFPNHPTLDEIQLTVNLSNNNPQLPGGKVLVKTLTFTAATINFSYQSQPSNRVLQSAEPENFLVADFGKLRFENQNSSTYIINILTAGILINGRRYHYLGQSNSHLKQRKCFLIQRNTQEVQQFLNQFGDWSKFNNIAKLAKRIGLLFSSGVKVFDLPSEKYQKIDDVERNGHCFTDGCGLASKALITNVAKAMSLEFRQKRHYPSVIQIRYQGFKGILCLWTHLSGTLCKFRKSMDKFTYRGPDDFFVVDHSKPYTFGRLNAQTIMLLSSLGVPDDVFIQKQAQYFERLELMFKDLSIAFEYLLTNGQVDLASELFESGFTENIIQYLKKSYRHELDTSLKAKKNPNDSPTEKLRIIVKDSRIVFASADPTGKLRENECFIRVTIQNKPQTIVGPVFCVRNPCYHAGDIVVLNAVHLPECKDIVDVVLFSVNGEVPAAHRSAGGDLDGDRFFVCWDKDLMPRETVESYGYPGDTPKTCRNIQRSDMIKSFATQSNAGIARCADLFIKWANAKGPRCEECIEVNKLFSHAVDGSSVKIPNFLTQLPTVDENVYENRIWNRLIAIAEERRKEILANRDKDLFLLKMDREELLIFLEEYSFEATDYELLCFLIRWCHVNKADITEFLYYIDFSSFNTYEKLSTAATKIVPRYLLFNALHMSRILKPDQIKRFDHGDSSYKWKLFHYDDKDVSSTSLITGLLKAVTNFRRVLVVLEFNHQLTFCISLHGEFTPDIENDADEKIIVYGFNNSVFRKKFCRTNYRLCYDEGHFQIYASNIRNTFVWLGVQKKLDGRVVSLNELNVKSQISIAIDKLCHQTARVTDKIQKKEVTRSEIYVVSNRDGLHTNYQRVNPEYVVAMEQFDINANYNPLDPANPKNDNDKNLLSLSFINELEELMKRMECWAQYGVYDKVIDAYNRHLRENRQTEDSLQKLAEFVEKYPMIHGPLTKFIASQESEIPSKILVSLIGTCLKASKSSKDVLVMKNIVNLLCCNVTLSMLQVCQIVTQLVVDHPHSKMTLEYLEILFEILEQKLQPLVEDSDSSMPPNTYFMCQIKRLFIQTLEELQESSSNKKASLLNRYQARQSKIANKFSIISTGSIKVKVRPGDLVVMNRLNSNPNEPISTIQAVVISTEPEINIEVSWVPRDILVATWEVNLIGNIVGFRHSMEAIRRLNPVQEEEISTLLSILLDPQRNAITDTNEGSSTSSGNQNLNPSQQAAVNKAENGHLTLWQGPAGTGKTKSIFQLILSLILNHNPSRPLLVTAATNAAVDNIAKLLVEHGGIQTIRIGNTGVIHPDLHSITLDAGLDGSFRRINTKRAQQLLKDAKVICATCVGCGTSMLEKLEFEFVIIDEASQVSEPVCLIPLAKKCEHFLMVGDHKQLRPFCMPMADEAGYSISLFERMFEATYPVCLLDTQYRMHPGISRFPNDYFYSGRLNDGIGDIDRPLVNGFAWPNPAVPVAFFQVTGEEENFKGSKFNQAEVDKIFTVVKDIVDPGHMTPQDIGIISLYSAQLEKMKEKLNQSASVQDIEVKTADGFQGREKELILITCVRCNEIGKIGFLEDKRRFNVMLTRAKRGLIVFGDRRTLCSNEMWKEWFNWVDLNGLSFEG